MPASFKENVLGAIPRFVGPRTKLFAVKFSLISKVLWLQGLQKKLWAQFHDLCVQNRSGVPWNWDAFWKFFACKVYRKSSGRYTTIYVPKNAAVCSEVLTHLWSFRLLIFTKKVLGAFSRSMRPKMKLFAVELRRISKVLCLQVLQKMFWAQFHDLRVQKRSCLPWNSDAFWKFSACKFWRKSCGRNSTICASKNKAVCCEVQTHSGSSLPASFKEKVVGAIPRFMCPKTKLFAAEFRRISEVLCLRVLLKKFWAQFHDLCVQNRSCLLWNWDAFWKFSACKFWRKSCGRNSTICASKNKAVCCEVQTHFGSSPPASFKEKVVGAIPWFMRPKTKLFALKFRCILKVLCLRVLRKSCERNSTILC